MTDLQSRFEGGLDQPVDKKTKTSSSFVGLNFTSGVSTVRWKLNTQRNAQPRVQIQPRCGGSCAHGCTNRVPALGGGSTVVWGGVPITELHPPNKITMQAPTEQDLPKDNLQCLGLKRTDDPDPTGQMFIRCPVGSARTCRSFQSDKQNQTWLTCDKWRFKNET